MNIILKHGNARQKEVALKKLTAYSQMDEPCPRECPVIEIESMESVSVLPKSPPVANDVPNIVGLEHSRDDGTCGGTQDVETVNGDCDDGLWTF